MDPPDNPGITMEETRSTIVDAIRVLENGSARISRVRRRKVLKAVTPEFQDLAYEDIFGTAAPELFGSRFDAKMKERVNSMNLLHKLRPPSTSKN